MRSAFICVDVIRRVSFVCLLVVCGNVFGETLDGARLYESACAACHGSDGRGRSQDQVGFEIPLPDFTSCTFNSREQASDWVAIAHEGGPVRAFSQIMPAFGSALSKRELETVIERIKKFCSESEWPRGELNLPRAMFTEKAFPEDEAVLAFDIGEHGSADAEMAAIWEKRIGARGQIEIVVPYRSVDVGLPDGRAHGVGDVAVGAKYAFSHDYDRGRIWAVGGEVVLPTGDETRGLGNEKAGAELYLAFGKLLPSDSFVQSRLLVEGQLGRSSTREAAWQTAFGKTWISGEFGRSWTPMIEVIAARELEGGATTDWDIVPQLQISLSRRQHILFAVGAQLPVNDRQSRDMRFLAYVLWDWYDGGLLDGW